MNAVDTNVFVYAFDNDEPIKQAAAVSLIDRLVLTPGATVLLWQVAGELLACLRRWEHQGKIQATDVDSHFNDVLSTFKLALPHSNVFKESLSLSERFSLSHWDSMLLAACIESGVDTLYSEDLSAGTEYDSVTVINPFR